MVKKQGKLWVVDLGGREEVCVSREVAQKLLDQTLEGGSTDVSEGTTKYGGKAETETNDIDKAFDELLA